MSRRPTVTEAKVKRVICAAQRAGLAVTRVEVDNDGKIIVMTGKPSEDIGVKNDLDAWMKKHAGAVEGH